MVVSGGNVYVSGIYRFNQFSWDQRRCSACKWRRKSDAFVALLSADLKTLIQSTYLGGNSNDDAQFHGRFRGECLCIAGNTESTNFPGTGGGAQPSSGGWNSDAFVALLSADLKTLIQSTYLGGNGDDYAYSMAVLGGNVYVAGHDQSTNFPGTSGGAQPSIGGGIRCLCGSFKCRLENPDPVHLPWWKWR